MKGKMKSSIKRMSALLTMMAVAVFALTFTACSDDDEPIAGVTYTYGFPRCRHRIPIFLKR